MSQTLPTIDTATTLETLLKTSKVHRNLNSTFVEQVICEEDARLVDETRQKIRGGIISGASPSEDTRPFDPSEFDALSERILQFLIRRKIYIQDLYFKADMKRRSPIKIINTKEWDEGILGEMFRKPTDDEMKSFSPEFTIVVASGFFAARPREGDQAQPLIVTNHSRRLLLIAGLGRGDQIRQAIECGVKFLFSYHREPS